MYSGVNAPEKGSFGCQLHSIHHKVNAHDPAFSRILSLGVKF